MGWEGKVYLLIYLVATQCFTPYNIENLVSNEEATILKSQVHHFCYTSNLNHFAFYLLINITRS